MKIMPYFFPKIKKNVTKFVICCSRDWRFKGYKACTVFVFGLYVAVQQTLILVMGVE